MAKAVRTTPQADLHILEVDAWWQANREKAPDLFASELAAAFETISIAPGAGHVYPYPRALVRRVVLRATRHHVYYVERDDHVLVVAVWGAVKAAGPDLEVLIADKGPRGK